MKKIIVLAAMTALLQTAAKVDAAPIVLEPAGVGVYNLNAVDLPEVGGIDVEIEYDRVNLANPNIAAGEMTASSMFMTNTDCDDNAVKSGSCHKLHNIKVVAAASLGIKGSGRLATISFDLIGGTPESVFIVRQATSTLYGKKNSDEEKRIEEERLAKLENARLAQLDADRREADRLARLEADRLEAERLARLEAERIASLAAGYGGSGGGGTTTVTGDGASPSIGSITLPQDQMASTERKPDYQPLVTDLRKDMNVPLGGKEAAADAGTAAPVSKDKPGEKSFEFFNGAVDLFKAYKGEKTTKALISLFAYAELKGYTQNPPVAIADGTTPLAITLVLKVAADESPSFVMQGATITQLSRDMEKSTWTIQAVPKKDVAEARMTVIDGPRMLDYPLTVTPKIDPLLTKGKQLSDADFTLYLTKPPKYDLNGDKKFDALDDYIYTANYILAMKIKPEKGAKPETKEKGVKPETKEKIPADKKAAPAGKESKAKDGSLVDEEKVPVKASGKK